MSSFQSRQPPKHQRIGKRYHYWIVVSLLLVVSPTKSLAAAAAATVTDKDSADARSGEPITHGSFLPRKRPRTRPESSWNRDESSSIHHIRVDRSSLRLRTPPSLSEQAIQLSGDSSFARRLQEEEQNIKQAAETTRIKNASARPQAASPIVRGGMALLALGSLCLHGYYGNGNTKMIQDILSGSASALAIAWLPTLVLRGGWMEMASLATLFVRPTVRHYLLTEFVPSVGLTLRKMVLGEVWRRIWTVLLAPLPKHLFVPSPSEDDLDLWWVPGPVFQRMQRGLHHMHEVVDKSTQGLIRKSVEQSVYGSLGLVYESVANSLLEVSILYYDDSASASSSVSEDSLFYDTSASSKSSVELFVNDDDDDEPPALVCDDDL
jgi:hypothetical protein